MITVSVELTWPQLVAAVDQLSEEQKELLRERLEAQLEREAIGDAEFKARLDRVLAESWAANPGLDEGEVMADVVEEIHHVRGETMSAVNPVVMIELSAEQLLAAFRRLPIEERITIFKCLETELRQEVRERFSDAVQANWEANRQFTEEEVMRDVEQAIQEVRAERRAAEPA